MLINGDTLKDEILPIPEKAIGNPTFYLIGGNKEFMSTVLLKIKDLYQK